MSMGKILKVRKGYSVVTKVETKTETFNPELLYKVQHFFSAPHNVPIDYVCKTNSAGEHQHHLERFFHIVYGKDLKSAASYYMKHRIAGEYLKKGYFKKIPPIYQLRLSICGLRLSADICKEGQEDPKQLGLNYHIRCIVNFAAHQLGIPGMPLAALLEHHRNDDFRSVTNRLGIDDTDADPDFISSRFFGILAYWAKCAYDLLMKGEPLTEKTQMLAVLCWHAITYLFNSRKLVLAGHAFPSMGKIVYLESITAFEKTESGYDDFYEQNQPPEFETDTETQPLDVMQDKGPADIPGIIADTFSRLAEQLEESQKSECALSTLESLFEDQRYTGAIEEWSGMMTPEAIALQRAETTRKVFTLLPAQIAHLVKALQKTADQFELENISFSLPQDFTPEALVGIDYNQLYLAASSVLPRLQIKSKAIDAIRKNVDQINNLTNRYCDAYKPEPGQIPRPSVLRTMGTISQQISDDMEFFSQQWNDFVDQILNEHSAVLALTLEYQSTESERREISRQANIKQQEEISSLKNQLAGTRQERDSSQETIQDLVRKLEKMTQERDALLDRSRMQNTNLAQNIICFKDIVDLHRQKVSCADVLRLAEDLYGNQLRVLDSAKSSVQSLGLDHAGTMARQIQILVDEYMPAIICGTPDSEARKCFPTNVYSAKESVYVAQNQRCAAERMFIYNNKEYFFEQHLRVGKNIRIHFILDLDAQCVVIGHCGYHLTTLMTANQ